MATIGDVGTYFYGFAAGDRVNREDLLDLITNLDPWDTPWVSQAPKVRASHVSHEWLTDTLPATSTAGAIEGDEYALDTDTQAERCENVTQIFRRDVAATETQRSVNPAGFRDAYAYSVQKATKAIARNIEVTVLGDLTTASGGSAVGRVLRSFQHSGASAVCPFMITATAGGTVNTLDLGTGSTGAGLSSALTESDYNTLLETVYTNGGNPESTFVSPAIKRVISGFTSNATGSFNTRNVAAVEKRAVAAIDIYDSDFGLQQLVLDRWVPQATDGASSTADAADYYTGRVFIFERAKNRLAWLRPVQHIILGKSGDSIRGIVVGEVTLAAHNF